MSRRSSSFRFRPILSVPSLLVVLLLALASPVLAETSPWTSWSSALAPLTEVHLEKEPAAGPPDEIPVTLHQSLPDSVISLTGEHRVGYEAFEVIYLPVAEAEELAAIAQTLGLGFRIPEEKTVHLPWHRFSLDDPDSRVSALAESRILVDAVPDLHLVRFAYPIRHEWLDDLRSCEAEPLALFGERVYLVHSSTLEALTGCSVASYLSWIGPYLNVDRVDAGLLTTTEHGVYEIQFVPGIDLVDKAIELGELGGIVEELHPEAGERLPLLRVGLDSEGLLSVVSHDSHLLSLSLAGESTLSGEQQGQIVAGNYTWAGVPYPGYYTWLSNRGLLTSSNPQTVAVIDAGFDDGRIAESEHHPDLRHPVAGAVRLTGLGNFGASSAKDSGGHGTMVSGIAIGHGLATGAQDSSGFHYGSGISPHAFLYAARVAPLRDTSLQQQALSAAVGGSSPSMVVNQSWNLEAHPNSVPNTYVPTNSYESVARFFDERVFDADPNRSGWQDTTIVFSAGNYRGTCNSLNWDTVSSPATAKNVLAVGATSGYHPHPSPPLDCRPCSEGHADQPEEHDATNIADVANFSGRGVKFGTTGPRSYNTVIKPDLVAPGNRVFSTVPHYSAGTIYTDYNNNSDNSVNGCKEYYPTSPVTYHTYGVGTSFAAPVVTGVASLARKKMLDSGAGNVSASLVKAALIATADDLGGLGNNGNDHRPSPRYGWGRVNLDRVTNSQARFIRSDNLSNALTTGESISWTRTIGNGSVDTYITLAWTDKPTALNGSSQVPLVNDLSLKVNSIYRGNAFNEAMIGVDNGYSYPFQVCSCPQDSINTVESVFIPAGTYSTGQSITITVTGENVPQPIGSSGQMFGLYAYNVQ